MSKHCKKETKMDYQALEAIVIGKLVAKLEKMQNEYTACKFWEDCELKHLQEMVKLCHQIRSLVKKEA